MKTTVLQNPRDGTSRLLDRALIGAGLLLLMLFVGVEVARPDGAVGPLASSPATTAYHFSSHPMIAGTVVTVNDREMVVNTDQGEQMTLTIDSRTMAPRDLAPGMVMRAEFLALEDCRFYAQRIMPIRRGMSTDRLQAYAVTRDSREAMAHDASESGGERMASSMTQAGAGSPPTMGEHSPGMAMMATPTTADYHFSTRPMVSGRVVSVNDHRLVVETDQGQPIPLVMDSHTMVPGEVAPGSTMRAEFTQMKDGRYYAKRISRIGSGVAQREQAYAHTRDSDAVIARNLSDCGAVSVPSGNTMSAAEPLEAVPAAAPSAPRSVSQPERPETLPQTASHQPLILLLGLSLLGLAVLFTVLRRARIV